MQTSIENDILKKRQIRISIEGSVNHKHERLSDAVIRSGLISRMEQDYADDLDTLIIQEMGICQGDVRIDVAVINGFLHGFEIKSDRDSLIRLPRQIEFYSKCLERATIVTSPRHMKAVLDIAPRWWGVIEVSMENSLCFKQVRHSRCNPAIDLFSVVRLLWRNEVLDLLKERGFGRGLSAKTRFELWEMLVEVVKRKQLLQDVRKKLKQRQNWRAVCSQV